MRNQQDSDYDEVYVVDDSDHSNAHEQTSTASSSGTGIIVSLLVVLFVPLALACLIGSSIAKGSGLSFGDTGIPLIAFTMLSVLLYLMFSTPKYEDSSNQEPQCIATANASRPKNYKKKRVKRSKKKGLLSSDFEPMVDENQKMLIDIGKAVDALTKLGYSETYAQDWVFRGISYGLKHEDTQGLVRFALNKGQIIDP